MGLTGGQSREGLLIAGGEADPNIHALLAAAHRRGCKVIPLLVGESSHPTISWDVSGAELLFDGRRLAPSGAFVRHDVFGSHRAGDAAAQLRAVAWYTAVSGWVAATPEVRVFNRKSLHTLTNKPFVLCLARDAGLEIPETLISNDLTLLEQVAAEHPLVVKPVNGGGYCEAFGTARQRTATRQRTAAAPAIVQQRIDGPDIRVYRVGGLYSAFSIESAELDYRTSAACKVTPIAADVAPVKDVIQPLDRLLQRLNLDFAAVDFKASAITGRLHFLEVNTGPMFSGFDHAAGGHLADMMVEALLGQPD